MLELSNGNFLIIVTPFYETLKQKDSSIEWSICVPEDGNGKFCRPQSVGCVNSEETTAV